MSKKVFLNTTSIPANVLQVMQASDDDTVFVIPNTIDVKAFLNHVNVVKELVSDGKLVFHAWAPSWKDQWKKDMISSALGGTLVPAGSVEKMIPNAVELGDLIDSVAVPKDEWLDPEWKFHKAPANIFEELGIEYTENRSQVYQATDTANRPDLKAAFEDWYVERMASQHGCDTYLK